MPWRRPPSQAREFRIKQREQLILMLINFTDQVENIGLIKVLLYHDME